MGKTKLTYDDAIAKLSAIVDEIEGGGLSITALTAKVKEAMSLVRYCRSQLTEIQDDIEQIFGEEER